MNQYCTSLVTNFFIAITMDRADGTIAALETASEDIHVNLRIPQLNICLMNQVRFAHFRFFFSLLIIMFVFLFFII
jgi:hypothetical protein